MRPTKTFVVLALSLGAFFLGRVSSGHASSSEVAASAPVAPAPAPPQLARGLLCARRAHPARADSEDCDAAQLRASWCEGQLSECERSREAVRRPWPPQDTVEDPARWTEAVEAGLAECDIEGAELEAIDCSEYPCVAALRPCVAGGPDSESFRHEQQRLIEAVRTCAPLRDAFGLQDEAHDKALDVFSNDTVCPDGTRADFFALMALDPEGEAFDLLDDEDDKRSKRQERDLFRWLFRRGDDIAAQYPCER